MIRFFFPYFLLLNHKTDLFPTRKPIPIFVLRIPGSGGEKTAITSNCGSGLERNNDYGELFLVGGWVLSGVLEERVTSESALFLPVMTELPQKNGALNTRERSSDSLDTEDVSTSCEKEVNKTRSPRATWSSFFATSFSIFDRSTCSSCETKGVKSRNSGWMATLRKAITSGSMRRLQERVLGTGKIDISNSSSDVWLLGECYRVLPEESSGAENLDNGVIAFQEDFSSRIWMTYRKGFDVIADSKFSSDVNWGCMIRSSQMLVSQALVFHHLGRHWRRSMQKPYDPKYIEILQLFGDSNDSAFSIHNLLLAGKSYGLASGSWVGPYAMCRSWEVLARGDREKQSLPMVVYVVSGDEDGERGGAPVVHIDVASRLCFEFQNAELSWAPLLLLVPLVLGLDKVNPRYIPLLWATFTFPQSLGILGGKPGASTYIVGVQDDKALYLDPHEVQLAVNIGREDLEADTSSYHCSTVRHLPLEQIDPSLAIGFYCKDKDDFDDFCARATELADSSNGAPLFTVAQSPQTPNKAYQSEAFSDSCCESGKDRTEAAFCVQNTSSSCNTQQQQEDDWQLL